MSCRFWSIDQGRNNFQDVPKKGVKQRLSSCSPTARVQQTLRPIEEVKRASDWHILGTQFICVNEWNNGQTRQTDWLGQSRSSHTTEDCAEDEQGGRLPRSATLPRGHVGGHRCAHTGSWAVARPRRRRQNAPSRLLLGRGLFTAHVPSRDFWTRAAGMHYPLQ